MIDIDYSLRPDGLAGGLVDLWRVAARSVRLIRDRWDPADGTPVFTWDGTYTSRGWTEWTEGFVYGSALLLYEATGEREFLDHGRRMTVARMAPHVTHTGVHDHGFNNVSTYGTLLRQMAEGVIPENEWERTFYELALKLSGAVQAARWTALPDGTGYVYSFNGPHSLFSDTIRSMRALALSHQLGHVLMGEQDERISLLGRLLAHAEATARYNVYFGTGRDAYDLRGRVVHESIFNLRSGAYRCASTQQGYSPFSTWTRGLAWILAGYPEELEWLETLDRAAPIVVVDPLPGPYGSLDEARARFLEVARAVADFYIEQTPVCGVPYWDTGAPGLAKMGDYLKRPADPFNEYEPVDSSAAAIGAQGLLRLGDYLGRSAVSADDREAAARYTQAGLTVARTLFSDPYLSRGDRHEGILLHSVYHRPNGWDYVPPGRKVPCGESCMWGDYHALELGLCVARLAAGRPMQRFFDVGGAP